MRSHHEESKTIQRNGRWINVNGHTGQVLDPIWSFERSSYLKLAAALFAARRRSQMFGSAFDTKRGRHGYRRG